MNWYLIKRHAAQPTQVVVGRGYSAGIAVEDAKRQLPSNAEEISRVTFVAGDGFHTRITYVLEEGETGRMVNRGVHDRGAVLYRNK